jgi:acyl-CoA thioesterase-1
VKRRPTSASTLPPLLLAAALGLGLGCAGDPGAARAPEPTAVAAQTATPPAAAPTAAPRAEAPASEPDGARAPVAATTTGAPPLVVFLGDSLTAGLGLAAEQAFPALVAAELAERGTPIRAVNAGVSGDTSAGGLRRIDWLLRQRPDVVVVALGANDALRGQPVAGIEANLKTIVERARAAGAQVLLAGIQVPPSLGNDYARSVAAIYPRLADELDVALLPFLLEGVAGDRSLNQADGIHPNAEGQRRVAALVARHLEPLVRPATREAASR